MLGKRQYAERTNAKGETVKAKIANADSEREDSTARMRRNTAKKKAVLYRAVCQQIETETRKACSGNLVPEVAETKGRDYGQGDKLLGGNLGRVAGLSVALFGNADDAATSAIENGYFGKSDAELIEAGNRLAELNSARKLIDTLKAQECINEIEYRDAASYDRLRGYVTDLEVSAADFSRVMFSNATGLSFEQATSEVIKSVRDAIAKIKADNKLHSRKGKDVHKLGRVAFLDLIGMTPKVMVATASAGIASTETTPTEQGVMFTSLM